MNSTSISSTLFLSAMRRAGFEPDCTIIADGKLHRFRDWLDKPGTSDGWYVLFPDNPPAGAFGCWRRGIWERWSWKGLGPLVSNPKRFAAIEQLLEKDHQRGREVATALWKEAIPANGKHGYLLAKGIGAHGLRYLRGALLVPVMDSAGQLHGLQRIFRDGSKRFTRFTNKRGNYYMLGSPGDNLICLAEGFATAATIHETTGLAVVVAFDSGNLLPVAMNLRKAYPEHELIICADNDWYKEGNPGLTMAKQTSLAVGGNMVYPRFANPASRGTDFNDLILEEGQDAVIKAILHNRGLRNVFS